jgi:M6 family metalloprotease-like protein
MNRCLIGLGLSLTMFAVEGRAAQEGLGLVEAETIFLGEGSTNRELHPKATGTLKAIMLFASFPDGEEDKSMQELHKILVPRAVEFFKKSSYGRFQLRVDTHFKWYPMRGPSTEPGYDCSRQDSHRDYVAEVVAAADAEIDFSPYNLVYVVANKSEGTFNSPTINAGGGMGIRADGYEMRHAVTFGNDIRGKDWGWQTLVHETGHVLGLPDLYSYEPRKRAYKNLHRFTGSWDPMGFQSHALHYLAWHKYKLAWLDEKHFEIVKEGQKTVELSHIETDHGVKALVLPISDSEAYVAEVRHLSEEQKQRGVLIYKVSIETRSGHGPIRVMPSTPDDDEQHPQLARRYIALYDALYFAGTHFEDEEAGVRVDVRTRAGTGFQVHVTR